MASRIDAPLVILLLLGFVLSVLSLVFPAASGATGILLAYPAYWAFDIRHALFVRLYRRQALGIGLVSIAIGLLFTYFAILNSFPPSSSVNPAIIILTIIMADLVLLITFYWVDVSVLAGRRSDPLLRDTLNWSRIRPFVWGVLLFSGALLIIFSNPSSTPILVLGTVVVLLPLVFGSILLPIVARRSGDPTLRRHLRSFALFLVSLIIEAVLYNTSPAYAPTVGALLVTLLIDSTLVVAAYFLYSSVRSLAPLNKLALSE
jgi:hypothetical protein